MHPLTFTPKEKRKKLKILLSKIYTMRTRMRLKNLNKCLSRSVVIKIAEFTQMEMNMTHITLKEEYLVCKRKIQRKK